MSKTARARRSRPFSFDVAIVRKTAMTTIDRLTGALTDRYRLAHGSGEGGMVTAYPARDIRHEGDSTNPGVLP